MSLNKFLLVSFLSIGFTTIYSLFFTHCNRTIDDFSLYRVCFPDYQTNNEMDLAGSSIALFIVK